MEHMTEFEGQLAGHQGDQVRRASEQTLDHIEQRLRTRINAGLPAGEFATANALLDATLAAREVLERWPSTGKHR